MLEKDPNQRPTVKQLRQHRWVTRNDTEPMPEQPFLPLEITDDDINRAVKRFDNTFTLVKAGKKWKSKLDKRGSNDNKTAEDAAEAEAEEAPAPAPSTAPDETAMAPTETADVHKV